MALPSPTWTTAASSNSWTRPSGSCSSAPRVDRPQRVRPRGDADRDVRVHGRPVAVPAEPGPRQELRGLPRPAGRDAVPADRGAGRGRLLALRARSRRTVHLPAGTEVATVRGRPRSRWCSPRWRTCRSCPSRSVRLVTAPVSGDQTDRTGPLGAGKDVPVLRSRPEPGDALLFGLPTAVPRCIVAVRLDSRVEGVGVDPRQPPLVWEAWDGARWATCAAGVDSTGGLNRPGEVVVFVPAGHTASVVAGTRAGWLRCRVTAPEPGQPFYSRVADDPGGRGLHGRRHDGGRARGDRPRRASRGVGGRRRAAVLGEPGAAAAGGGFAGRPGLDGRGLAGVDAVEHFGASGPGDRHVRIDAVAGDVSRSRRR
ncbi:hypothetical protein SCALM49S_09885 [Streptomyces californicus]